MRNDSSSPRGYAYLKLFSFLLLVLIVVFGVARGVGLYQDRSFQDDSYTTLYSSGEEYFVVSFHSPNSYVVAELVNTPNLSLERASRAQLSLALEVPIDAIVIDPSLTSAHDIFSLGAAVRMIMFPHGYVLRDINGFDALKYFWLTMHVPEEERLYEVVDYKDLEEGQLSSLFRDEDIFNSAVSVEVMNGTEVGGLGGEFARVLTNRGYNVIAVTNTDEPQKKSFIQFNRAEDSKTAASLLHLLGESRRSAQLGQSADIVIVVGADVAR